MASRSRERKTQIPGYDEARPTSEDRKRSHRASRHAAHQMLHTTEDFDDVAELPTVRRSGFSERGEEMSSEPSSQRFKVWKTKFWKRRGSYQALKESLDADWDESLG